MPRITVCLPDPGTICLEKADEGRKRNNLRTTSAFANNLLNEQVYEAVSELQKTKLEDFKKSGRIYTVIKKQIEEAIVEAGRFRFYLVLTIELGFLHYKEKRYLRILPQIFKSFELIALHSTPSKPSTTIQMVRRQSSERRGSPLRVLKPIVQYFQTTNRPDGKALIF